MIDRRPSASKKSLFDQRLGLRSLFAGGGGLVMRPRPNQMRFDKYLLNPRPSLARRQDCIRP
jgi:hypothetical protein